MNAEAPRAELDGDVLTVTMSGMSSGWQQWFLLISDVHWDNPHCDRRLLEKHLGQAKERKAPIMSFGDLFCAMQGKYDPRSAKADLRPEHTGGNYLDLLVDTAADYFKPYPLFMVADGNHETAIRNKLETDLTQRLSKALGVYGMGYSGFVQFVFKGRTTKNLFFHHGSGGGGPVTKGIIRSNRQAVFLPDADIVIGGHVHEQWLVTQPRVRVGLRGGWYLDNQYHLCGATYKQEFDLRGGFHVERGRPPKPLGGWWLRFFYDETQRNRIGMEFTLAT